MSRWLHDAAQRRLLAAKLHAKYRNDRDKAEAIAAEEVDGEVDRCWREACEKGRETGKVAVCWLDLNTVSSRVYNFRQLYGRELKELTLDGIGLSSVEGICQHCLDLTRLSVASNSLGDITGIGSLRKLSHLNLLRNDLTRLPPGIGALTSLTRVELASNRLVALPDEIGNLRHLVSLNLESNELSALPDGFGRLACEVVNLNCNHFRVFPDCVLSMPKLRQLSIMCNQLTELYSTLGRGRFRCLEVLRASRNRITVLPDSFVEISSLQCLWLDYNRLAAVPPNFHRLVRLRDAKLEGNVDMVYPPVSTLVLGAEEIMRWSRNRLQAQKAARVRRIVQSLEEVLTLVQRHRIGGELHESLFRVNGECFQFPPDALWSIFLPQLREVWSSEDTRSDGIQSFPFECSEVEQALFGFRDAAGSIVKRLSKATFRRCSCVQTGQRTQVCIPPRMGWMCTRPALLVRMKVAYEENMREKRRLQEEEQRLEAAATAAEALAKSFLATDDGRIMVHDEAEKRLSERQQQQEAAPSKASTAASSMPTLRSLFGRKGRQDELRRLQEEVRAEYIDGQVSARQQQVLEGNRTVRWIMKSWLGVTTDQVFQCWRNIVEQSKRADRREARRRLREERLRYEDAMAAYNLEQIEFAKWEQRWDDWNDVDCWVHNETGDTLWGKPSPPLRPLLPESMIDAATSQPLSAEAILRNEADSSTEDEGFDTDSDVADDTENEAAKSEPQMPAGLDEEVELARQRVLARRIKLLTLSG
ncbi:hypothetical protein ACHAXT_004036 [Thalassiosira profunda]